MSQVDINHARALVYQLLSSLFAREIDEKRLKELTSKAAQQFWNQLGSDTQLSPSVDKIRSRLNEIQDNEALLELAADYCGIFLVGTKYSASPYASLYLNTEDEPLLFGQQHQQMSEFLHQSKLQVKAIFLSLQTIWPLCSPIWRTYVVTVMTAPNCAFWKPASILG